MFAEIAETGSAANHILDHHKLILWIIEVHQTNRVYYCIVLYWLEQ